MITGDRLNQAGVAPRGGCHANSQPHSSASWPTRWRAPRPVCYRLRRACADFATTTAARAGDTTAGFWFGADGSGPSATGSGPYTMPTVGGSFGGYVGELGTWTNRLGCTSGEAWNAHDAAAANTNHFTYHRGVGTGGYWFAGGPGADPHYNATTSEAYAWGKQQGEWAHTDWQNMYHSGTRMPFQILWMDIENAGNGLANGWGEVFARPTTCTRHIIQTGVAPALDRATFNGYWDYLHTTQHNVPQPGAYSAPRYLRRRLRVRQEHPQHLGMELRSRLRQRHPGPIRLVPEQLVRRVLRRPNHEQQIRRHVAVVPTRRRLGPDRRQPTAQHLLTHRPALARRRPGPTRSRRSPGRRQHRA